MVQKSTIIRVALVFLIPVGTLALFFFFIPTHIFGDHVEHGESMSRSEITNRLNFPLVQSATNICFYAASGGLQSWDFYFRVSVARQDITNQVSMIVDSDVTETNRLSKYANKPVRAVEMPGGPGLKWWTPQNIGNGFYIGAEASYAYQLWIDQDTGTLFIHQHD